MNKNCFTATVVLILTSALPACVFAEKPFPAEQLEFFESRIRPVLIEHCYQCHNSTDSREGGLAVDHRQGILDGGDGGPIVIPGQPGESRLLAVLRHEVDDLKMPEDGPKLDDQILADFERWIALGMPDPRDQPPSAEEIDKATSWEAQLERRKAWWSFQTIRSPTPPAVDNADWSNHPIDRFVLAKLEANGLRPAPPAEAYVLVRRLYFNIIGLPPSADEAKYWTGRLADTTGEEQAAVFEKLVGKLLDEPSFGERWARHWMDWIRYAESHGSEGDPEIDNVWHYRDYLIRALNADVPYDQLVREHVAGDLLENPRINESLGVNESLIGPVHWRMVFHGFAPTDALDEKVRFTDDQINVFSKAFLGLTVSCARCHDHKFDAISQRDYYALFGVLGSCRPGRTVIDLPQRQQQNAEALAALKPQIREAIAQDWLDSMVDLAAQLIADEGPWKKADQPGHVLHPLFLAHEELEAGGDVSQVLQAQMNAWLDARKQENALEHYWNLAKENDYADWFPNGFGLPDQPQIAGKFAVASAGDHALTGIYPAGVYSHLLSTKHAARLTSNNLQLGEDSELWVRVIGAGQASARFVVQNYPREGTVYPVKRLSNKWNWQRFDLSYWSGDEVHIELTTAKDAPLLVREEPRSWFGIRAAVIVKKGSFSPGAASEFLGPLFDSAETPPQSCEELAGLYAKVISLAIEAWRDGSATDAQALLLDACLQQDLLPNKLNKLTTARPLLQTYRKLESEIPVPTRVPGLDETMAHNQSLYQRGNHKLPGDKVPRRFLEAIDPTPYETRLSGRLQLADDLLREDNPLPRRVIVNRVWHHLFGRGIVATPDNFGRLGAQPTHPELLDWLATRFVDDGWSLKSLIRLIVTSETWQLSSQPTSQVIKHDPNNLLLSHANIRRLEAEAIRDSLLAVSGDLDRRQFGNPVNGDSPRRSIYVGVVRNSLDPFLRAFDFPEPFSATGRRDATNVPAQSLTLMNDGQVAKYAAAWADRLLDDAQLKSDEARIGQMFLTAFGRTATANEVELIRVYLASTERRIEVQLDQLAGIKQLIEDQIARIAQILEPAKEHVPDTSLSNPSQQSVRWQFAASTLDHAVWTDLARAMFTFKEFIYVR